MPTPDVVFVAPPRPDLVNPHAQAPLGLLYLAAVIEHINGPQVETVQVVNLAGCQVEAGLARLPQAACYALTGTFLDVPAVNALARGLRARSPRPRILVGGPICLSAAELDLEAIDCLVTGEAEEEIYDLIRDQNSMVGEGEFHGYAGTFTCSPPQDLDAIPMPAWHLWSGPFGGDVFIGGRNYFGGGSITLLTTRGCPNTCAFCAGPALAPRRVRFHSPARVVAEMERAVLDYGVRQFRLSDEFFTCYRPHVQGVCEGIMRSRVLGHGDGLVWRTSVGVKPHDHDLFRTMRAAGCREISIGVESADPAVLDLICRKGGPDDAQACLANARAAGLLTRALMMVGTPGETRETLIHNLRFLRTAPYDAVAVTVFTPIPGSAIAREPQTYKCRILDSHRSICLYGPDGRNQVEPTIELEGFPLDERRAQMRATVAAAEHGGKVGRG